MSGVKKAKEYIKELGELCITSPEFEEDFTHFMLNYMEEFKHMSIARGCYNRNDSRSNNTTIGILNELDNKWKAICRGVPWLREEGFRNYIYKISPGAAIMAKWDVSKLHDGNYHCEINKQ